MDSTSAEMTPEQKYNEAVDFSGARVDVVPLFHSVVPGFVNRIPVLFQIVTCQNSSSRRDPFSLAIVLDVSGSMQGSRLDSCKAAILQLIEAAQDDDQLSLVTYSTSAAVVFEHRRCGDEASRRHMRAAVNQVVTEGSTNLYAGLLKGYEILHDSDSARNKHIFLLSDGLVNEGHPSTTAGILAAVEEWEEKIPILSYGIGNDFNEKLMSPLGQVHRVARNVELTVSPLTKGLYFPDNLIDGIHFPLVREKSVIQYVVDLKLRPQMPPSDIGSFTESGYQVVSSKSDTAGGRILSFEWHVEGFPLLENCRGQVDFRVTRDRSFRKNESPEVRTYLDVKRACDLRRSAATSPEGRRFCEQALQLFKGRLEHDRFGFAAEWATKTKALLDDGSLWSGDCASSRAAKHLGVCYAKCVEEEEEEEMDFDLFG